MAKSVKCPLTPAASRLLNTHPIEAQRSSHKRGIVVVDFGSQYTQLIARRVRELQTWCEILSWRSTPEAFQGAAPAGIILSGGPESATHDQSAVIPDAVFSLGVPVLGICYGMQALARQHGGRVASSGSHEFGFAEVSRVGASKLLPGGDAAAMQVMQVWMSHADRVDALPPGFKATASSSNAPIAAMEDEDGRLFGLQFHPEVTHTPQGLEILERFVHGICEARRGWTTKEIVRESIDEVRAKVGKDGVILALSGGVDSSVMAALLHRAVGDQLRCVMVDNGLLRLGEADEVRAAFDPRQGNALPLNLRVVDAREEFISALARVADPEQKRGIIGETFIRVFEREAGDLSDTPWLAQGTIYPDVVESAAAAHGHADLIKSHHNVGGLPERMKLGLIEPLRELFKDEVRQLGLALGLPDGLVHRHPFPGPGLAVRHLGAITSDGLDVLRRADKIFLDVLREYSWYSEVSQAFAVLLPVRSVGVVGDARRYARVIALRAVVTSDFMTADWARLPHDCLAEASNRIINEISEVSRVVYDVSSKPPATIEWE